MNQENTARIVAACPRIFRRDARRGRTGPAMWPYFECGDGWTDLLVRLATRLGALDLPPHFVVDQVKEKWGGLRFYVSTENEAVSAAIKDAESEAARTCESCGQPGEIRCERGWYRCRCGACE